MPGDQDIEDQAPMPPVDLPVEGREEWAPEGCGVYEYVCECGRGQLCRGIIVIRCPEEDPLPDEPAPTALASSPPRVEPTEPSREPATDTPIPEVEWPTNTPEPPPTDTPGLPTETTVPPATNTPVPLPSLTPAPSNTPEPLPSSTRTPTPKVVCPTPAATAYPGPYPEPYPNPKATPAGGCATTTPAPTALPRPTNTPVPIATPIRATNTPVPLIVTPAPSRTPRPSNTPVPLFGQCRPLPTLASCRGGPIARGKLDIQVVEACHLPGEGGTDLRYKVRIANRSGHSLQGQAHPVVVDSRYASSVLGRIRCFSEWRLSAGQVMTIAGTVPLERGLASGGGAVLEFRSRTWSCDPRQAIWINGSLTATACTRP